MWKEEKRANARHMITMESKEKGHCVKTTKSIAEDHTKIRKRWFKGTILPCTRRE